MMKNQLAGLMKQAQAMRATGVADESLPTEAGKDDVTATVNGSAQMTK